MPNFILEEMIEFINALIDLKNIQIEEYNKNMILILKTTMNLNK